MTALTMACQLQQSWEDLSNCQTVKHSISCNTSPQSALQSAPQQDCNTPAMPQHPEPLARGSTVSPPLPLWAGQRGGTSHLLLSPGSLHLFCSIVPMVYCPQALQTIMELMGSSSTSQLSSWSWERHVGQGPGCGYSRGRDGGPVQKP